MQGLHPMDLTLIIIYLTCILGLGLWAGRKVKSLEEYAVAGRSFGPFIIFATLSASFIGGGYTMGNAEKVFTIGVVNILALWGFSLKEVLVAKFIAPRMNSFSTAISVGDVMETNFGKWGKIITGVFSVLLCAGILGAQVGGIGYIFELFLGLPRIYGILIGTGIVIAYDTFGGMRAVVFTDIIQFVTLSLGIPLALFFGISELGGVSEFVSNIPDSHLDIFGSITPVAFISLFLTFLLGETLVPPYVRRLFISRSTKDIARGTFWSGIFSVPFFAISGLIGLVALQLSPDLNANMALPYVVKEILPIGLRGLVVAGVIGVVMSSADSFLNSASVAFVQDIVQPLRSRPLDTRQGLTVVRLSTAITGAVAIVFASNIPSILDILIYAYNFWSPIILVPLAATMLGVKSSPRVFFIAAMAGLGGVLIWNTLLSAPGGFDGLVVGAFTNFIAFFLATKLTRKA